MRPAMFPSKVLVGRVVDQPAGMKELDLKPAGDLKQSHLSGGDDWHEFGYMPWTFFRVWRHCNQWDSCTVTEIVALVCGVAR
jgi:hypothetical protein